ncbi:MAG TPA: hypothetical protein VF629_10490 [Hymenobacter sp.]|jgi:hypothetical protein|uniref:hypothetical protein n=1 Tax=Hymenobacter sp. TaxID=1898978 RepID=UPI002ED9F80E
MCHDCFEHEIYRFASQNDFDLLETQLQQKLARCQLLVYPISAVRQPFEPESGYQCQTCRERWFLASPDKAWRGYLLTAPAAEAYVHQLRANDTYRRILALVLFLLLVGWLVWQGYY